MLTDQIGTVAGAVYRHLETKGEATVSQLQKGVKAPNPSLIPMAIGWLAREGKISARLVGKTLRIRLNT
jgi:hypothetical protein